MDQVLSQLKTKTAVLDQFGNKVAPLRDFCDKQNINTGLPLGAALFVVGLITMLIEGWYILTMFLTILYPGLHSIRAIESEEKDDDKVWLTYWMIFGLFNVLETFFGFIFYFIPYFDWVRLGFFIWLLAPQFHGA
jgi:receptor expression-enhancing protein 5/6